MNEDQRRRVFHIGPRLTPPPPRLVSDPSIDPVDAILIGPEVTLDDLATAWAKEHPED